MYTKYHVKNLLSHVAHQENSTEITCLNIIAHSDDITSGLQDDVMEQDITSGLLTDVTVRIMTNNKRLPMGLCHYPGIFREQ